MHFLTTFLPLLAPLALAAAATESGTHHNNEPDVYEAIHQREAILAETLDTKDWNRIGESVTKDVYYDSRPLGAAYGGLSVGINEFIDDAKAAFGDANVAHHVSNAIIRLNDKGNEANVTT